MLKTKNKMYKNDNQNNQNFFNEMIIKSPVLIMDKMFSVNNKHFDV